MPLSTQEYKWVAVICWGNLTNCWGVTCNGLASRPGGVEILLAASWYGNRDKLRPDEPVGSKGFTHINHYIPCNYVYCWGRNLFAEVQMQLEIKFLSLDCKKRNAAVEIWWHLFWWYFKEETPMMTGCVQLSHMNVTVTTMNWTINLEVTCRLIDYHCSWMQWIQILLYMLHVTLWFF